jgi:Flagellar biosynthesis protein, FliO
MSFAESIQSLVAQPASCGWVSKAGRRIQALLRRIKPTTTQRSGALRVESRLALGPKRSMVVVSCRGERFLVACGSDSISAVVPLHSGARSRGATHTARFTRRAR